MIWSSILGWLGKLAAGVAAVFGAILYFKRQGAKEERAEQTEKSLEQAKEANEIEAANRKLTRAELDERMRKYQRD